MNDREGGQIHGATIRDTPVGTIRIWTGANGIKKLSFEKDGSQLAGPPNPTDNKVLREAIEQLELYFSGKLRDFNLRLDLSSRTRFQLRVIEQLRNIPYGRLASYKDIAEALGEPQASRSVGQALKANPIPVILPCHRVIRSDGTLGGYAGNSTENLQRKTTLLEIEGVEITGKATTDTIQEEILSFPL
ncbi:MAG: methylated-DNA--[protein]-cysteine S-methyltransferase [bacterium]